jgi:hypothetical protein
MLFESPIWIELSWQWAEIFLLTIKILNKNGGNGHFLNVYLLINIYRLSPEPSVSADKKF